MSIYELLQKSIDPEGVDRATETQWRRLAKCFDRLAKIACRELIEEIRGLVDIDVSKIEYFEEKNKITWDFNDKISDLLEVRLIANDIRRIWCEIASELEARELQEEERAYYEPLQAAASATEERKEK